MAQKQLTLWRKEESGRREKKKKKYFSSILYRDAEPNKIFFVISINNIKHSNTTRERPVHKHEEDKLKHKIAMWPQSMKTMQLLQIDNFGFKNNGPYKQETDKSSNEWKWLARSGVVFTRSGQ